MTHDKGEHLDIRTAKLGFDLRAEEARVAKLEAEADMAGERVATEQENRRPRFGIAIAALALMAMQVLVANGIFGWYGVVAGWAAP